MELTIQPQDNLGTIFQINPDHFNGEYAKNILGGVGFMKLDGGLSVKYVKEHILGASQTLAGRATWAWAGFQLSSSMPQLQSELVKVKGPVGNPAVLVHAHNKPYHIATVVSC